MKEEPCEMKAATFCMQTQHVVLVAVARFDARLLAVAQKLCPMIEESFEAVKQEITQMAAKQVGWEAQAGQVRSADTAASPDHLHIVNGIQSSSRLPCTTA